MMNEIPIEILELPNQLREKFTGKLTEADSGTPEAREIDILLCLKARGFLLLVLRNPLAMSDDSSIVEAIFSPVFRPLQARSLMPLGTVYTKFEVC
jgi:hypothetical protein